MRGGMAWCFDAHRPGNQPGHVLVVVVEVGRHIQGLVEHNRRVAVLGLPRGRRPSRSDPSRRITDYGRRDRHHRCASRRRVQGGIQNRVEDHVIGGLEGLEPLRCIRLAADVGVETAGLPAVGTRNLARVRLSCDPKDVARFAQRCRRGAAPGHRAHLPTISCSSCLTLCHLLAIISTTR